MLTLFRRKISGYRSQQLTWNPAALRRAASAPSPAGTSSNGPRGSLSRSPATVSWITSWASGAAAEFSAFTGALLTIEGVALDGISLRDFRPTKNMVFFGEHNRLSR